jgi:GNAT superfamily N-acetyltransferase
MTTAGMQVRDMTEGDAAAVAALMPDLGYAATTEQVLQRFCDLKTRPEQYVLVASVDGAVAGWLHVYGVRLLESEGYAEVGGLVVATALHRQGIGRALLTGAQAWAQRHGYARLRLGSGVHREAAHLFYESLGYAKGRASYTLERQL